MAVVSGGKLGISDAQLIKSVYDNDFVIPRGKSNSENPGKLFGAPGTSLAIRSSEETKTFDGVPSIFFRNTEVVKFKIIGNKDNFPGGKYRKSKFKGLQGAALRLCFIRIKNSTIDSVRFFLGPTTNRRNLLSILKAHNLIPTIDGEYVFIFSFNGWVSYLGSSHPLPFIPSDDEYTISSHRLT